METIRLSQIKPGVSFSHGLYTANGQKLLNAGVELSDRHVQAIHRCGETSFLLANSIEELVEAGVIDRVDRSSLKVGQTANREVLSGGGRVIVEAGEQIEEHHLDALQQAGDSFASKQEAASQRRERILLADALVDEIETASRKLDLRISPDADNAFYRLEPAPHEDWPSVTALTDMRSEHVEMIRLLFARIEAGVEVSLLQFNDVIDDLLSLLQRHPTRFTQLALLCPRRDDYLPDHAYTVTVLSMATAAMLRWSPTHLRELGLTGLLFDLGMLLVPERIRVGGCTLTDIDRSRVQRHPIFSLAMLQPVEGVPMMTQIAALQHHERENGAGYPRALRAQRLGDYARVLAVCDTFAAATEPRHYRKAKLPYMAMEELLRAAGAGQFWKPAARALIQAAGLFPVGSFVRLSSGRNANVTESNPVRLDRPVVQPLDASGRPRGDRMDLNDAQHRDIAVARPLATATG